MLHLFLLFVDVLDFIVEDLFRFRQLQFLGNEAALKGRFQPLYLVGDISVCFGNALLNIWNMLFQSIHFRRQIVHGSCVLLQGFCGSSRDVWLFGRFLLRRRRSGFRSFELPYLRLGNVHMILKRLNPLNDDIFEYLLAVFELKLVTHVQLGQELPNLVLFVMRLK